MEKRIPELSGRGAWVESGAPADAPALLRKAKPARTLSLVVRRTAQTVQMQVYPAPHDPYRERPAHEKRYAQRVEEHHLASPAPPAQLVAQRVRHMTYGAPVPVRLAPELSAVLHGVEAHYVLLKPPEEPGGAFGECHRFVRALGEDDPFLKNMAFNSFVHNGGKDTTSPSRIQ